MMLEKAKKIFQALQSFLLFAIIFFTPLIFTFVFKTKNSFILPKLVFFKIFVLFYLLIYFINLFLQKRIVYFSKKNLIFFIPVLLLFFSLFLSTVLSLDKNLSFYGDYYWQEGFLTYIYYFLFFFLLVFSIEKKDLPKIIWAIILSVFVVSAYAFLQAMGYDPLPWAESVKVRAISTLGQPNNLGAFLLLGAPFAFYQFFKTKSNFLKIFLLFALVLSAFALFASYSFASWLALFLAFFIFSLFSLQKKHFNKKNLFLLLGIFSLLLVLFFSFGNKGVMRNKIHNFSHLKSGSTAVRLQVWQAAWGAIKKRPFLGYGLASQQGSMSEYYKIDWAKWSKLDLKPIHAHNVFLDILLTQGLVGLLAWGLFYFSFFYLLIKNIQKNKNKNLNKTILFSFLSFFIFLQFNFYFVAAYVYVIILYALALLSHFSFQKKVKKIIFLEKFPKFSFLLLFLILFAFYYPFSILLKKNINTLIADYYWREVLIKRYIENEYMTANVLFGYIEKLKINDRHYAEMYADMILGWLPSLREYGIFYDRMAQEMIFPHLLPKIKGVFYTDYLLRGRIYSFMADDRKEIYEKYYKMAEKELEQAIKTGGERGEAYMMMGKFCAKKGDYNKALQNYEQAVKNTPDLSDNLINKEHRTIIENRLKMIKKLIKDLKGLSPNTAPAENLIFR